MSSLRMDRINSYVQELLAEAIRKVKDPRVSPLAAITEVRTAKDLSLSKVFVSFDGTKEEIEGTIEALMKARAFLKREIGARLTVKTIPDLVFLRDDAIERGARVLAKLGEIAREREASPPPPPQGDAPAPAPPRRRRR